MTERRDEASNSIEVMAMFAMVFLGASQLIWGPDGSRVLLSLEWATQRLFALLALISALSVLRSMRMVGLRGAYSERAGMVGCTVALAFYSSTLPFALPHWNTSMACMFAFIGFGTAHRAWAVDRRIRYLKLLQRGPQ